MLKCVAWPQAKVVAMEIECVFMHSTCITPSKGIDQTDLSSAGAKGIANETRLVNHSKQ